MPFFPTTQNGSVCQFPFQKTLHFRTILNTAEDNSRVVLEDPPATAVRWKLRYAALTDAELAILQEFFATMFGRLRLFTFLDPSGNLLTWSEDFSQPAWQKSPLLQFQTGTMDPLGTQRATSVTNNGPGELSLAQSISIPAFYPSCFSVFARSEATAQITLTRGSAGTTFAVTNTWQQFFLSASTSDGAESSLFALVIPPSQSVELFGMMIAPQPSPALYTPTLDQGGVYPATRFDLDSFSFTSDAPNSNHCDLSLYSRLPL
jgi:hypothetical protein